MSFLRQRGPVPSPVLFGRITTGFRAALLAWCEHRQVPVLAFVKGARKDDVVKCRAKLSRDGQPLEVSGEGNGPLAALVYGLTKAGVPRFEIANYSEHALGSGEEAAAIAYIQIKAADGKVRWGAGVDTNIAYASVRAVLSALNRL